MRRRASRPAVEALVLVADADPRAARSLARRLWHSRLWTFPTTRGEEALRLARAFGLALAVIDARLEDMAGPELVARLRALDDRLPVVMTIARGRAESEVEAREAGIVYYASKPLDLRRLHAVARRAVRRGRTGVHSPGAEAWQP